MPATEWGIKSLDFEPNLKANPVLERQIRQASAAIIADNTSRSDGLTYQGDVENVDFTKVPTKAHMPDFLYRPLYGRPRSINVPEIRRLSDSPTAGLCIKTIIDECTAIPWHVRMKDTTETQNDAAIEEVTQRLDNPNRNKENLTILLKKWIRDILCVDAGVCVKVFDLASYEQANPLLKVLPLGRRHMVEFYAYDGGTYTMNPNINGILPDQRAYFQYNFHHFSMPVPFARDELVYMMANPRTNNIYGVSPMELAYDVIRYFVFGVTAGIDHFTRNEIPKGVISVIDANKEFVKEFRARLEDKVQIQDPITEELRWLSSKIPVINQDVKFVPFSLTPETVQLLETEQWYIKIVLACFGVTPSEAGFTEDSNRATEIVQSEVFRRKAVMPMLNTLEYYINREIMPEFGYDNLWFEFIREDIQADLREQQLWGEYLKNGQRTINEWRADHGDLNTVSWGDEPYKGSGFGNTLEDGMRSMFRDTEKQGQ